MHMLALPKVELHHHLDCDVRYPVIHQLDPGISEDTFVTLFVAPARCENLAEYLTYPPRTVALLQDPRTLRLAVEDVFDQLVVTPVSLTLEYERLTQTFGWKKTDLLACNLNALNVSFAPPVVKNRLSDYLTKTYCCADNREYNACVSQDPV